jgi:hypothetical protein
MPVTAVVQDTPRIERGHFTKAEMQALKPVNFHMKIKLSHGKNGPQTRTAPEPTHAQPEPAKAAPAEQEKPKPESTGKKKPTQGQSRGRKKA